MVVERNDQQKDGSNKKVAQKKETVGLSSNPVGTCQEDNGCQHGRDEPGKVDEVLVTSAVGILVYTSRVEFFIVRCPTLLWRNDKRRDMFAQLILPPYRMKESMKKRTHSEDTASPNV